MTTTQTTGTIGHVLIKNIIHEARWEKSPSTGRTVLWIKSNGQNATWDFCTSPRVAETFRSTAQ
jgi:hypothetical protein